MQGVSRTPTETLMKAAEDFGEVEPEDVLIIWTDQSGHICWSSSTDSQVKRLGMLEMVKQVTIKGIE